MIEQTHKHSIFIQHIVYFLLTMKATHSTPFSIRSYRLRNKRPLGKLMITDNGCEVNSPGIGDVAFVKDLMTGKIVTTKFQCSVFGLAHSGNVGWVCNKKLFKRTMSENVCLGKYELKEESVLYTLERNVLVLTILCEYTFTVTRVVNIVAKTQTYDLRHTLF